MHRFYAEGIEDFLKIGGNIYLSGNDVNHVKNVLRMKTGDTLTVCNNKGIDYICTIDRYEESRIRLIINDINEAISELSVKLFLYQGIPKSDKMELIIQKSVELGVYCIVPVMMKHTVVKIDNKKKEDTKLKRWQMIAESAAKQSRRGFIPIIENCMSYDDALTHASNHDLILIPYENAEDMENTRSMIKKAAKVNSVGIFIGSEGGFDESEIQKAKKQGGQIITLGKRILRTETAAFVTLSYINYEVKEVCNNNLH